MRSRYFQVTATIERKDPTLPRFVVIPGSALGQWSPRGTTTVEAEIDNRPIGRRSLKAMDASSWFIELTQSSCQRLGLKVGDSVVVNIRRASTELPDELRDLIDNDRQARTCWHGMPRSQQRMLREHILAAKRPETRKRRAIRALK